MVSISEMSGPKVEIAPGLFSPKQLTVKASDLDGLPYLVTLTVRPVNGRLEAVDVLIAQLPDGIPVTRTGVAELPLTTLVELCGRHLREQDSKTGEFIPAEFRRDDIEQLKSGSPARTELELLARIYRVARATTDSPGKVLQHLVGVDRATITRWLSRAEKLGLLAAAERGRRKSPRGTRTVEQLEHLVDGWSAAAASDLSIAGEDETIWGMSVVEVVEYDQDE